jgi:hypothetical protein
MKDFQKMIERQIAFRDDCELLKLTVAQQSGHQPKCTRLNPREFRGWI